MQTIMWLDDFSSNLSRIMDERGLTIRDLSRMSGVSRSTLYRYLNETQMPTAKAIINLSIALGQEISDLVTCAEMID